MYECHQDRYQSPGNHDAGDPFASAPTFGNESARNLEQKVPEKENARAEANHALAESEVMGHLERGGPNIHAVKKSNHVEQEEIGEQALADTPARTLPHVVRGCESSEVGGFCLLGLRRDGHKRTTSDSLRVRSGVPARQLWSGRAGTPLAPLLRFPRPLENDFDGELHFARRGCCSGYLPRDAIHGSSIVENVCAVGSYWRRKIRVVEYVEDLGAELHI